MNDTDMSVKLRQEPLNEREKLVVRLRDEEKLTLREIGVRLGMSCERARQIHRAAGTKLKDFAENGEDALSLLPMRARRVVVDCEIGSRARARAAMESGRLSCSWGGNAIFWNGVMLRQLSSKTWVSLYEWAGCPTLPTQAGSKQELKGLDESGDDAQSRLRGRARQLVVNLKIGSRARARAAIESGQLSWNEGFHCILWEGGMLRNVGSKTWAVLYAWAGRPAMPPFQFQWRPPVEISALDGR